MQLAKLEIKGFKSFADKIVIHFDKGITGVVGPNGCGKSNIVDAIRWVLGEQKISMLRSEKMENIIFNGTKKRRPLQLAEVSITFNNVKNIISSEYSQLTITRRLYRSGESEYLINQVVCRLKDISNLFLNTGISTNCYAIIELSMVDELLADYENARRRLFEEAAGVSKFKKRKKETLQKLEATDADLDRVEDLLYEINKNMKSLEKQAKKAKKYYLIKQEYQQKSVQLSLLTVEKEKEQFKAIQRKIADANGQKTKLTAEIANQEVLIEASKTQLENKEKELVEQQKLVNQYGGKVQQHESQKQITKERLKSLKNRIDQLKTRIEESKKDRKKIASGIQPLMADQSAAQKYLNEKLEHIEALKKEYNQKKENHATLQQEVEKWQNLYSKQQEQYYQLNKEQEIGRAQIVSLEQEVGRTNLDTDRQQANIVDFEKRLLALQNEINQKKINIKSLTKKESHIQNTIATLEESINTSRNQATSIERKLDARKNEHQLIKSMAENMEGFPEAIKFLNKNPQWNKATPTLSDIISTTEEYRITIENYLKPYLNYYVVENEKEALNAISMLHKAGKGRANFFLLKAFKNFTPSPIKSHTDAFPAIQVIEHDQTYKALMNYLFDKTYICTGNINTISSENSDSFITPTGDFTRRAFSLSGGSIGLFEGKKIGRKQNLEKLEQEINNLIRQEAKEKEVIDIWQKQLEKCKQETLKTKIELLEDEIKLINDEFISLATKKEQFLQLIDSAGNRKESIEEKINQLKTTIENTGTKATQSSIELNRKEQKLHHATNSLKLESQKLDQQATVLNEQLILYHQQENKVKSVAQEIQFKKESTAQITRHIEENIAEFQKSEYEIKTLTDDIQNTDKILIDMYAKKETMENALHQTEKNYYTTKKESNEGEKVLRDIQHQRENIDGKLIQLQNDLSESKLSLSSIKERLSIEFKVDLDKIMNQPQEEEVVDEQLLRNQIDKTKEKIEKISPINPMAMEAYNEIKERNDFISSQKEDLIQAKESLFETVSEIEKAAGQSFIEVFEKARKHFINVFRSLFQEGDACDIKLLDTANPLESKIEIIAQPKGKRPIVIDQLSGGEKTLTAIALLFSMYLIKPAPFCILDEVDAPLDDANIDKFRKIIRNFSKESQFVIITHNKRTMLSTDVIYGITMAEEGISKTVPVNLRSFTKESEPI